MISVLGGAAMLAAGCAALLVSVLAGLDLRDVGFALLVFACVMCLPMIALALPIAGGFALWIGLAESHTVYLWTGSVALALSAVVIGAFLFMWLRKER